MSTTIIQNQINERRKLLTFFKTMEQLKSHNMTVVLSVYWMFTCKGHVDEYMYGVRTNNDRINNIHIMIGDTIN